MKNVCLFTVFTYLLPIILLISLMLFMLSIKNIGGFLALTIMLLGYLVSMLLILIVERRKREKSLDKH